jgi:hypothetical protein
VCMCVCMCVCLCVCVCERESVCVCVRVRASGRELRWISRRIPRNHLRQNGQESSDFDSTCRKHGEHRRCRESQGSTTGSKRTSRHSRHLASSGSVSLVSRACDLVTSGNMLALREWDKTQIQTCRASAMRWAMCSGSQADGSGWPHARRVRGMNSRTPLFPTDSLRQRQLQQKTLPCPCPCPCLPAACHRGGEVVAGCVPPLS